MKADILVEVGSVEEFENGTTGTAEHTPLLRIPILKENPVLRKRKTSPHIAYHSIDAIR